MNDEKKKTIEHEDMCAHCLKREQFVDELEAMLNRFGYDTRAGVPDFILAEFMMKNLETFIEAEIDTMMFFDDVHKEEQKAKENAS